MDVNFDYYNSIYYFNIMLLYYICMYYIIYDICIIIILMTLINYILYGWYMHGLSYLTLCDSTDCGPPGFSVRGISQARILEWVAISYSRWSSQPRDQTSISCIDRQIFYHCATWKNYIILYIICNYIPIYLNIRIKGDDTLQMLSILSGYTVINEQ